MIRTIAIATISIIAALSGCAAMNQPPPVWGKPGLTAAESDKDKRECNYDAQKVFYSNVNSPLMGRYLGEQTFSACMRSRGYRSSAD